VPIRFTGNLTGHMEALWKPPVLSGAREGQVTIETIRLRRASYLPILAPGATPLAARTVAE
jgi:hypothetical protein